MFLPQEVIRKKREGQELSNDEIAYFVKGITSGEMSDSQIAALAMAVFFQGMSNAETVSLTQSMTNSGDTIGWSELRDLGPVLDKHSTGGVGDKLSLMIAPIISACGGYVPMISGRGLGHTGGTLDKLDAIPGYQTSIDIDRLKSVTKAVGCAIVGQTGDLAPADKRFYAIRDITATVEAIPLITASILSKKLSAGLDRLVMDIKVGSGAFSNTLAMAEELAATIVNVANGAGLPTRALITDMDQVLGSSAGNALEVREAWSYLSGEKKEVRTDAITTSLCAELLILGGLAKTHDDAQNKIMTVLSNGKALEQFQKMISGLGGPTDFCDKPDSYLKLAKYCEDIYLDTSGYLSAMDTREIGMAVVALGGGRSKPGQEIDHSVGFDRIVPLGTRVDSNHPVARIHANSRDQLAKAKTQYLNGLTVADNAPCQHSPILKSIAN
ncbi:thymidine phosphorylase [Kiloniella spongiae]|uniref:Thymidine phosphorylase n=1 Tax=Kiloniella spongiae TaxID=1489064 RepID=A0A0H2MXD0_9PROT|nr:thymidine phosphorylase [Kiloniella spongiae]KLN61390.1 thymidine phosphorylase [Kiloniella spongiae]